MTVQKARLIGFDILKVVAAYGVVVIHGLGDVPKGAGAERIAEYFLIFSVPTFLMVALYFSTSSLSHTDWRTYLFKRHQRILIPFYAWSLIYLAFRLIKQIILKNISFDKLLTHPTSLLFGSAGVQLYFLPLLFTGIITSVCITRYITQQQHLIIPMIGLGSSLYLGFPLQLSGIPQNAHQVLAQLEGSLWPGLLHALLQSIHPQWLAESIVIVFSWVLYCLPYSFVSVIFLNSSFQKLLTRCIHTQFTIGTIFLLLIIMSLIIFFQMNFLQFSIPILALFLAILISGTVDRKIVGIAYISQLSFGIYLIHGILTAGLSPMLTKFQIINLVTELSPLSLLSVATLIFTVSGFATAWIARHRTISKILLGGSVPRFEEKI